MRPILALALAVGLLLAPVALASGGADDAAEARGKGRDTAEAHDAFDQRRGRGGDDANETARHNGTRADVARDGAAIERHGDGGRPAWVDRILSFRLAWRENATAIREECHAQATPEEGNWTKEQKLERAHCIRDGYKGFFEAFREELRELRQRLRHAAE